MSSESTLSYLVEHATSTQLSLFALIMISLWLAEHVVRAEPVAGKWAHSMSNMLFVVPALPIQIVMMWLCVHLARWTTTNHWGLVALLPWADTPWVRYGAMFFVMDLLDYVYHFAMHQVPAFWRFHLVHHTDRMLDVSTTVREHPGETLIRNATLMLWVFSTGASVELLVLRQTVETVSNILAHTAFRLPARPARILGWLLITPNLHQTHHHFRLPATNRNYGDVFSIWDRLFGTFMELRLEDTVFGLDTAMALESALPLQSPSADAASSPILLGARAAL